MIPLDPDEIERLFQNLSPDDFARDTSAVETVDIPDRARSLGLNRSDAGFEMFIQGHLTECRVDAWEDSSDFTPRAILANSDVQRKFHGEDDESPGDWGRRLRREATAMQAHWMFVALVSPARAVLPGQSDPPPLDPDDIAAVHQALEDGSLGFGVCWTAASITSGTLEYRGGIIYLADDGKPGDEVEGAMDPDMEDPFCEILSRS